MGASGAFRGHNQRAAWRGHSVLETIISFPLFAGSPFGMFEQPDNVVPVAGETTPATDLAEKAILRGARSRLPIHLETGRAERGDIAAPATIVSCFRPVVCGIDKAVLYLRV